MTIIIKPISNRSRGILDRAASLTEAQLSIALDLTNTHMANDRRGTDPAVLAALIQALAINYGSEIADISHFGADGEQ